MENDKIDIAMDILNNKMSCLLNELAINDLAGENELLQEKINVLQDVKDMVYKGNSDIIEKVIEKNKKGIL